MCLWVVTGLSLDIRSACGKRVEQAALGFSADVRGKTLSSLWENARRKDGPGEGVRRTHWAGREDACWGPLASKSWWIANFYPEMAALPCVYPTSVYSNPSTPFTG